MGLNIRYSTYTSDTNHTHESKKMRKPTRATLKSFINKNRESILVKVASSFNGMTDGVEDTGSSEFSKAHDTERNAKHTLGITGVWLVLGGRDFITPLQQDGYTGYTVTNCCGKFSVAVKN